MTVSSDFKRDIDAADIFYTAGIRLGFRPTKSFKYGVTLTYTSNYTGEYLLPIPDLYQAMVPNTINLQIIEPTTVVQTSTTAIIRVSGFGILTVRVPEYTQSEVYP